jgi:hypothetical protein
VQLQPWPTTISITVMTIGPSFGAALFLCSRSQHPGNNSAVRCEAGCGVAHGSCNIFRQAHSSRVRLFGGWGRDGRLR